MFIYLVSGVVVWVAACSIEFMFAMVGSELVVVVVQIITLNNIVKTLSSTLNLVVSNACHL